MGKMVKDIQGIELIFLLNNISVALLLSVTGVSLEKQKYQVKCNNLLLPQLVSSALERCWAGFGQWEPVWDGTAPFPGRVPGKAHDLALTKEASNVAGQGCCSVLLAS